MGLDMFAFRVRAEDAIDDFKVRSEDDGRGELQELAYWRKHHDLHGWMERLYRAKGGTKPSFNCVPVRLTNEDLDALMLDVVNNKLPQTTGFFSGENPPDNESIKNDLMFIAQAKSVLLEGDAVYYDSWW